MRMMTSVNSQARQRKDWKDKLKTASPYAIQRSNPPKHLCLRSRLQHNIQSTVLKKGNKTVCPYSVDLHLAKNVSRIDPPYST